MWDYDVEFAGKKAEHNKMYVVRRPDIPAPVMRAKEEQVAGRDGTLYISDGTVEDIVIQIEFNFMGKPEEWFSHFRMAKKWLLDPGSGKLKFGDDTAYFYKVKRVIIETAERVCYKIGKFTASFYCNGYQYREDGERKSGITKQETYNPHSQAHPTYLITGVGECTLEVNGLKMRVEVNGNITIDTEKMISYSNDGKMRNTSVAGDYEDLYLNSGENTVHITKGFKVEVVPNWRCL